MTDQDSKKQKAEQATEQAEEERRQSMFRKRIEIARQGVRNFQLNRVGDAAKSFHLYLRVLEESKGVGEGGLHPTQFDIKKDLPELLLISGVYWDLVKMYDQTQSEKRLNDFRLCLDKFVVFSKGMPYHALSAETLRKYLRGSKPKHRAEIREAYFRLTGSRCFMATSLLDVCEEQTLGILRRFRDECLERSVLGRRTVLWYYRIGPGAASMLDRLPQGARRMAGKTLDFFSKLIKRRLLK